MTGVPATRIDDVNGAPVRREGRYVLYWMTAARRTRWNFAFQRAVEWARELDRPLLVLEALRVGYRWASDRLHRFILEGMAENERRLKDRAALYFPYVEPRPGDGKGLLAALAAEACVVVTDDFPEFFLPKMLAAAAPQVPVRLERVDSNGLLPMRSGERAWPNAVSFRRFLQRHLGGHLQLPEPDPLARVRLPRLTAVPAKVARQWPRAPSALLRGGSLSGLPIDHAVQPSREVRGGAAAAEAQLAVFLDQRLQDYAEHRSDPDVDAASGLSPYLHFGHISAHQVFADLMERERWSPSRLATLARATGSRGWWGVGANAEAFLDELVTWRELGFNFCAFREDYGRYESLPEWARATLERHAGDPRRILYSLEQLERGETYDELWNAAQRQLVREGRIHNYLRMLWGKKVLEWTREPREALEVLIELNNKYALDGRDPNSYSGIFWVFGRYDRPWGPERPIFGKVRYMSSQNTARKLRVGAYLERYATL